jgi:putative acetyltransferase
MKILLGRLDDVRVQSLIAHHARTSRAETAPGSAHALDLDGLRDPAVTLWSAWEGDTLVGIGALKRLSERHAEIKSMHTVETHRRTGVGSRLLQHILNVAQKRGFTRVSLETGSSPYFEQARSFYRSHGFVECAPFGDYLADTNSTFMTLEILNLDARRPTRRCS